MGSPDLYQQRYLAHQVKKRKLLAELLAERHSDRVFADQPLELAVLQPVISAVGQAPSSCDRHAILPMIEMDRDRKALLGGLLVGGVGWVHRAPAVIMLHADAVAYRAGDEITYMPYLDAGVAVGLMYLAATAAGLACCYINPNIRESNRAYFQQEFGVGVFCGALAVGYPRGGSPDWVGDTA